MSSFENISLKFAERLSGYTGNDVMSLGCIYYNMLWIAANHRCDNGRAWKDHDGYDWSSKNGLCCQHVEH